MEALIVFIVLMAVYLFPTFLAVSRQHRNTAPIAIINVLAGWTGIGWLVALVWAATYQEHSQWRKGFGVSYIQCPGCGHQRSNAAYCRHCGSAPTLNPNR